jgi:hypothetical protein
MLATNDMTYLRGRDAKVVGQIDLPKAHVAQGANVAHVIGRQFSVPDESSLLCHVAVVVGDCPKEEMGRVAAAPVVAAVANTKTARYGANGQLMRETVSLHAPAAITQDSSAKVINNAGPIPAAVSGFIDSRPEGVGSVLACSHRNNFTAGIM